MEQMGPQVPAGLQLQVESEVATNAVRKLRLVVILWLRLWQRRVLKTLQLSHTNHDYGFASTLDRSAKALRDVRRRKVRDAKEEHDIAVTLRRTRRLIAACLAQTRNGSAHAPAARAGFLPLFISLEALWLMWQRIPIMCRAASQACVDPVQPLWFPRAQQQASSRP